jgi:hypothetical protein
MNQWRTLSSRFGSQLPDSLLIVSIQRCGRLDALIRSIEDEFESYVANPDQMPLSAGDTLHTLSETWIGSVYAILYVLARKVRPEANGLEELYDDTRLIRVALEKHEIPSDRILTEPIELQTVDNEPGSARALIYDRRDPLRSHIMQSGINPQGSICWLITDLRSGTNRWLARRYISDRVLGLLPNNPAPVD